MVSVSNMLEIIKSCYLPKLSRNLEESRSHLEFQQWVITLSQNFPELMNSLNNISPQTSVLSSTLLLYFQLVSKGEWNTKQGEECAMKLDCQIELLYHTTCANLLKSSKIISTQDVFDKSIESLHQKLSPDEFKKYPALIEAYCLIMKDVKYYDIVVKPASVLPVSLLLIEDYVNDNRIKGLKTCSLILKCLTCKHFNEGNYYEVIYRVLKKTIVERDLVVTKLLMECLFDLLQILPSQAKVSTADDALGVILEQMYTETNLYRKKEFFGFIYKIIHIHGFHCAKRTMFLTVITDNLDICSNSAVNEILLKDVLECLRNWIRYCWIIWRLASNTKLMSTLIKILYVSCKDKVASDIEIIFLTLCQLSSPEEQIEIHDSIEKSLNDIIVLNKTFAQRLQNIKDAIFDLNAPDLENA